MVDLHTHILPDVDDGAENVVEAIEMLQAAANSGTKRVVFTPHYLVRDLRCLRSYTKEELFERFNSIKALASERVPGIELYMGAEVAGISDIQEVIDADNLITINNTKYVLLEFGFHDFRDRAMNVAQTLLDNGYIPIIAHPERYDFVQRNPRNLVPFIESGMLLQVNTTSLEGMSGEAAQDVALSLIENRLAAVVSSDAHSMYRRIPDLSEAFAFISSNISKEYAEKLFYENPFAVLNGHRL